MGDGKKIVLVCGPTATGKSHCAIEIATALGGEVVGADSMQIYRHMDIGTAKATDEERNLVPHHLIDVVEPDGDFSAAEYGRLAGEAVDGILSRGRLPVIAGGTGLYMGSLVDGIFEGPGRDDAIREELTRYAEAEGREALHRKLSRVDPESGEAIHYNNISRVIRAIEVFRLTGTPLSELHRHHRAAAPKRYSPFKVGLELPREDLYKRIDDRVDEMFASGLVGEVEGLLQMGYSGSLKAMKGLGYREGVAYLKGETTIEEARRLIKRNTRHYAKRQLTWFKRDGDIRWYSLSGGVYGPSGEDHYEGTVEGRFERIVADTAAFIEG